VSHYTRGSVSQCLSLSLSLSLCLSLSLSLPAELLNLLIIQRHQYAVYDGASDICQGHTYACRTELVLAIGGGKLS